MFFSLFKGDGKGRRGCLIFFTAQTVTGCSEKLVNRNCGIRKVSGPGRKAGHLIAPDQFELLPF